MWIHLVWLSFFFSKTLTCDLIKIAMINTKGYLQVFLFYQNQVSVEQVVGFLKEKTLIMKTDSSDDNVTWSTLEFFITSFWISFLDVGDVFASPTLDKSTHSMIIMVEQDNSKCQSTIYNRNGQRDIDWLSSREFELLLLYRMDSMLWKRSDQMCILVI